MAKKIMKLKTTKGLFTNNSASSPDIHEMAKSYYDFKTRNNERVITNRIPINKPESAKHKLPQVQDGVNERSMKYADRNSQIRQLFRKAKKK